jgi:sec-independent protein translocase protein TatA
MTDAALFPNLTLALGLPGGWEWFVILAIGLLIFGRRLPEIAKGLGKSIVEFKKGIKGVEEEIEDESSRPKSSQRTSRLTGDAIDTKAPQREQQPVVSRVGGAGAAGAAPDDEPQ